MAKKDKKDKKNIKKKHVDTPVEEFFSKGGRIKKVQQGEFKLMQYDHEDIDEDFFNFNTYCSRDLQDYLPFSGRRRDH